LALALLPFALLAESLAAGMQGPLAAGMQESKFHRIGYTTTANTAPRLSPAPPPLNRAAFDLNVALTAQLAPPSRVGMEERCAVLRVNCVCAEPMQTASWPTAGPNWQNPADTRSTDKQCSVARDGAFIEWLDGDIQTMVGVTAAQEPTAFAALPAGHRLTHVAKLHSPLNDGGGRFGHDRLGAAFVKRVAVRWYQYYSPNYAFEGDGGCQNNKLILLTGGDVVSEGSRGGNFHQYFMPDGSGCCVAGPGPDEHAIGPHALRGKWWRIEFVVINRAGGVSPNGIQFFLYMKDVTNNGPELRIVDTTVPGGADGAWVPMSNMRPKVRIDSINANLHRFPDGACPGYRAFSHFMMAGWDTDNGQRIGTAVEIEGTP
jgi:hypothetical protein